MRDLVKSVALAMMVMVSLKEHGMIVLMLKLIGMQLTASQLILAVTTTKRVVP